MKAIATIILPVVFGMSLLTGCGSQADTDPTVNNSVIDDHVKIPIDGDTDIHLWKTNVGGTECVVMDGYQSGGVTCNWNTP